LKIVLTHAAGEFGRRAQPALEGSLECNLPATILGSILDGLHAANRALFASGEDDAEAVRWVALRTPPYPMVAGPWPAEVVPERADVPGRRAHSSPGH
jgi:hypothetical protein